MEMKALKLGFPAWQGLRHDVDVYLLNVNVFSSQISVAEADIFSPRQSHHPRGQGHSEKRYV